MLPQTTTDAVRYADDFVSWCSDNNTCAVTLLRPHTNQDATDTDTVIVLYPTSMHPHEIIGILVHGIYSLLQDNGEEEEEEREEDTQ